jgi:hypothetical protein
MAVISFNLPDKYLSKKSQINARINELNGDFNSTQTKDGTAYNVNFENVSNATIFNKWLNELIPDIYEY